MPSSLRKASTSGVNGWSADGGARICRVSRRTWIIPDDCGIPGEPLAYRALPRSFSHAVGLSSRFLTLQLDGSAC